MFCEKFFMYNLLFLRPAARRLIYICIIIVSIRNGRGEVQGVKGIRGKSLAGELVKEGNWDIKYSNFALVNVEFLFGLVKH